MIKTKVVTVAAAMLMLGACGGGSSSGPGGGGTFTTSLPGSKVLNTLTPAEATTLCMDIGKAFSGAQLQQGTCKLGAYFITAISAEFDPSITDAQLKTMCMQSYTACLSEGADGGADMCMQPDPTCTATVAELSACLKDSQAQLTSTFAAIPDCNSVTRANLMMAADPDAGTTPMTTAACMTLETKCPDMAP